MLWNSFHPPRIRMRGKAKLRDFVVGNPGITSWGHGSTAVAAALFCSGSYSVARVTGVAGDTGRFISQEQLLIVARHCDTKVWSY